MSRSERVTIRGRNKLHINSVSPEEDNGCYTCTAKNEAGVVSPTAKFVLSVQGITKSLHVTYICQLVKAF